MKDTNLIALIGFAEMGHTALNLLFMRFDKLQDIEINKHGRVKIWYDDFESAEFPDMQRAIEFLETLDDELAAEIHGVKCPYCGPDGSIYHDGSGRVCDNCDGAGYIMDNPRKPFSKPSS